VATDNNTTDDAEHPLEEVRDHRDELERLARLDVALSDWAQRALDAIDNYERERGHS